MDAYVIPRPPRIEIRIISAAGLTIVIGLGLWFVGQYNYLLFHSSAEIFSIAVAFAVFVFSWNSRHYPNTRPFVLLGIGYGFVALLDLVHTFTFRGMQILPAGHDYATKLWVAARGLQALVTLAFAIFARAHRHASNAAAFAIITAATAALFLSIFWWDIFPVCFVEGQGVTPFKKASEYAISGVLAVSIALLAFNHQVIARRERLLLIGAFGLNIASEMVFTLYVSAYGYENLIGHLLKIASFALVSQALFASEVRRRITLINDLLGAKARLEKSETELLRANLSKDKFFSILAHDLRNPISGILSIAEVLAKRFDQLEPRRVRELVHLVYDGARQGADLLESILQWARAQTGKLEVKPSYVRLSELCEGVAGLHRSAARSKDIRIRACVEPEAVVYADPNMVSTVLRNLVSNAVKFTPRGGEVVVSAEGHGEWQRLSVRDTGIGMRPEDLRKLFRIDVHFSCSGTDSERGSGMGLILCKELVELNAGRISVESEPGKGSTFSVHLPSREGAGAPA